MGLATCGAYLARSWARGMPGSSVAQRLAAIRSFHRWAITGRVSPQATRGCQSARHDSHAGCRESSKSSRWTAFSRPSTRISTRHRVGDADRAALRLALAMRDRAIVETAYAAGLRISELASADLGLLDLRRGEVRVMGKGRKEGIGLLGSPARHALEAYLADGRPCPRCRGGSGGAAAGR